MTPSTDARRAAAKTDDAPRRAEECELCQGRDDVKRVPVIFEAEDGSYPKGEAVKMLLCSGCREECELG